MSLNTAAQQWALMESRALQGLSGAQRVFAKRMFYAGFAGALHIFTEVISGDDVSEEAGVHMVKGLVEECEVYRQEILGGRT